MEIKAYSHKVQYYETDKMGIVHHSNYIRWFEEARVDLMDQLDLGYDLMEKSGYFSPVTSVRCDYKSPTKFGDTVYVIVQISELGNAKFTVCYRIIDSQTKELRVLGETTHCFVNATGKIISLKRENKDWYEVFNSYVGQQSVI